MTQPHVAKSQLGFAALLLACACASTPTSTPRQNAEVPRTPPPVAETPAREARPGDNLENWSRIGVEGGRVEMAGQRRVFAVATETGLHLLEGEGCDQTPVGALVQLAEFAQGCATNRMFDPASRQSCRMTCRTLTPPSESVPSPRAGALRGYAGVHDQYLVIQTFNGLRMFEHRAECAQKLPLGVDVEFNVSPEGCTTIAIREFSDGPSCGLWCR